MYPFWDAVIAPLIDALRPVRVVEIGALRGETTFRLASRLASGAELHVIDPTPEFNLPDSAGTEVSFVLHKDISHKVLPDLPPVDLALIDGDHNWYTVYNELRMLDASAREAGYSLPVLVMHDVLWPYGRRDLYYDPSRIPEEFRHPYARLGMVPGQSELATQGGLNPALCNAVMEGGPRNGVMTALEDFLAELECRPRLVIIPIYFGLAIVADGIRLRECPDLAALLDRLEIHPGQRELLDLAEALRLDAMVRQHNFHHAEQARTDRSVRRYLDLLRGALLDEHYLENEARIAYLAHLIDERKEPGIHALRDPARMMPEYLRAIQAHRARWPQSDGASAYFHFGTIGRTRLEHLERCLEKVRDNSVPGDLIECGTGRGGGAMLMRGFLAANEMVGRHVWVADPFRPLRDGTANIGSLRDRLTAMTMSGTDLNTVRDGLAAFGLLDESVRFVQGDFDAALARAPIASLALLRIGEMAGSGVSAVLDTLYPKLEQGAIVILDGYAQFGIEDLIAHFLARHDPTAEVERLDWDSACWRKQAARSRARLAGRPAVGGASFPPQTAGNVLDLSVVVIVHEMAREAMRTLHSLTRSYQVALDGVEYEVLVVENGGSPSQRLWQKDVEAFGPEFRYVDLGASSTPSPASALNRGIEMSKGSSLALMIDGAHVLSPGVLYFGLTGLSAYEPAVVATQQWFIGPGQQSEGILAGYNEGYEDRLFESIGWPSDGYQLFDIAHFVGDRDWFDGMWESNCLFVPRSLLGQAGAFDESFSVAGGGYANLDIFERLCSAPGVTPVTILGEGSFHQMHGGVTTNEPDLGRRDEKLTSYGLHYATLRGREFRMPGKPMHYVGSLSAAAKRTRARRLVAPAFWQQAQHHGPDGFPREPVPMPDDLKVGFVDAFWRSMAWRDTKWNGWFVRRPPTDLFVYQELMARVRPDWIIETGTGAGGRALFLATACEAIGHGQVLTVDERMPPSIPDHPRLNAIRLDPLAAGVPEKIRSLVGTPANAMLIFGLASYDWLLRAFEEYERLVPVRSYIVIEDTITNGHPVWASMGPGPMEAVHDLVRVHKDFISDRTVERLGLTFNPRGFLLRRAWSRQTGTL